jgi:hypothetical protein
MVMFISEMLHHSIHEEEENESLLPFRNRITLTTTMK